MTMRVWECSSCSERFPEDGTGLGMGQALSHIAATSRAGDKHSIRGLVDGDTGELLVSGLSPRAAQEAGFVSGGPGRNGRTGTTGGDGATGGRAGRSAAGRGAKPKAKGKPKAPLDRERQQQTLKKATAFRIGDRTYEYPGTTEPPRARIPTPVVTTLEGWNLALPPYIFGLFSVAQQVMTRDDGREYEWTPEGLNDFLWDSVRAYLEFVLPPLYARATGGSMRESSVKHMLTRIAGLPPEAIMEAAEEAARDASGVTTEEEGVPVG